MIFRGKEEFLILAYDNHVEEFIPFLETPIAFLPFSFRRPCFLTRRGNFMVIIFQ